MTTFSNICQMTAPHAEPERTDDEESTDTQEVTTPIDRDDVIEKMQIEEEGTTEEESEFQFPSFIQIDSKLAWLVALSCSWIMFWSLLVNRSNSLIYISLNKELEMTREESAAPFSMVGAVSNLFAIFSGLLVRRYPLFWTSLAGCVCSGAGVILAAAVYNKIAITYCIGIISAIGQSLIFTTNMVAVNTYFDKNRATASGVSYIGGSFVSFFLPFIYEALNERFGFRIVLLLLGVLTIVSAFGSLTFLLRAVSPEDSQTDVPPRRRLVDPNQPMSEQLAFMKRPVFYLIVITGIVFAYILVLFNITVVDFALTKNIEKPQAILTLWFYAIGDLVGRLFSGQLSDRGWLKRRTVMALGFLLSALAVFGLALTSHKIIYYAMCSLYGLAAGSTIILFSVLIAEYLGLANLPLAIGFHCLFNGLASLPRARLIKYFVLGNSYRPLYLFFAIISIVTSIAWTIHCVFMRLQEDRPRRDNVEANEKQPQSQQAEIEDC